MRYKGHDIEITTWTSGQPWPETITFDGTPMEYAHEWESRAGSQIIYYCEPGNCRRHGVERKALMEARK